MVITPNLKNIIGGLSNCFSLDPGPPVSLLTLSHPDVSLPLNPSSVAPLRHFVAVAQGATNRVTGTSKD